MTRSADIVRGVLAIAVAAAASLPALAVEPSQALLQPALAVEKAPETYKVKLETTKGDVVIEVTRAWAPNGADRFYNLVKIGYYDGTMFFRVIGGFMTQIGMHGDPAIQAAWSKAAIPDDPVVQSNTRGMVTFAAQSAPNSRTTQFFINLGDNSYLTEHGPFAPFGRVAEGMAVVDSLYSGYGEGAPNGRGPSQGEIARQGNAYLKASFPQLDAITRASLLAP
jgi:peptidyl-prolyl cis-trans isomerase A (cyclophilin A)